MLEFRADPFIAAVGFINATNQFLIDFSRREKILMPGREWPAVSARGLADLEGFAREISAVARQIDMPITENLAAGLIREINGLPLPDNEGLVPVIGENFARLSGATNRLVEVVKKEVQSKLFLALNSCGKGYWEPTNQLFGKEVHDAFPSAVEDIEEAGKCLAVERGTACVMHLMRSMEVTLKALANVLNISAQDNWGRYIQEIDKELALRFKSAGKRSADEVFYAEVSESFERVKRLWRNRTMHVDQTYTPERAQNILEATRDFMKYLAQRIHE